MPRTLTRRLLDDTPDDELDELVCTFAEEVTSEDADGEPMMLSAAFRVMLWTRIVDRRVRQVGFGGLLRDEGAEFLVAHAVLDFERLGARDHAAVVRAALESSRDPGRGEKVFAEHDRAYVLLGEDLAALRIAFVRANLEQFVIE